MVFSSWLLLMAVRKSAQPSALIREEACSRDAMMGRFSPAMSASRWVEGT